jgi:dinuclear metal center YbgI/SA1388 family protein
MNRNDIVSYLDSYLQIDEIEDYGPQGLQVETDNETAQRIALAVDAAPPVIAAAAEWNADMLLVHHGVLWRDVERIAGPLGERVRSLMQGGVNLYAAHLPLDAHQEVGNNAVLAQMFGIEIADWWFAPKGTPLGVIGTATAVTGRDQFVAQIEKRLNTEARLLPHGPDPIHTVAIVSGFGAGQAAEARALGADTFLTGETSHANYWDAADYEMNIIYAGHYATETVGVQALGRHLAEKFGVAIRFFDFPTGM